MFLKKYRSLKKKLVNLRSSTNTSFRKFFGLSDYKRWADIDELSSSWDSRTRQIATLIEPGKSVIEFGAGRKILRNYLPDKCTYTPSDLIDRGEGTIVCDLNDDLLPAFRSYDVAVFSGVIEYINDVPRLISHLSNNINTVLISYAILEQNKKNRRAKGWVNDFSSSELREMFENAGYECRHTAEWGSQKIYKFTRKNNNP